MKVFLTSLSLEFPLATYCLAATLRLRAGVEVVLYDVDWARMSVYESKSVEIWRFVAALERTRPDVLGLSVYLWNHLAFRELASIVRRLFPAMRIVVGGPEIATTESAQNWLASGDIDIAIRGAGERTFERVVARLGERELPEALPGVSLRVGNEIRHGASVPTGEDLDGLASPFLDGFLQTQTFDRPAERGRYPRALLETYRGCYMECAYCQWGNGDKSRVAFAADRVRREISWLLAHDVAQVFIVDAMFGYKKRSAIELLEFIVAEKRRLGASTTFSVYHNQDFDDPRLFALYREAGVVVEIDLQSTNPEVLTKLGRGRWTKEVFERQLGTVRAEGVPTTGAADLIIGIPGDDLASFEASVDYVLRRRLRVNLYQASILPDTAWARTAEAEGVVASLVPPRAILETSGFPLRDMITARLIGHGTDLFNSFPRTADILWRGWFARPVELCRAVGERVFAHHGQMYGESHQYVWSMAGWLTALPDVIGALCPDARAAEILIDLMRLEGALAAVRWSRKQAAMPAWSWVPDGVNWRAIRPRFRTETVDRVELRWPVGALAAAWDAEPKLTLLDELRPMPHAELVYGGGAHVAIDLGLTDQLLRRLNGYFSIDEALGTMPVLLADLSPLWELLSTLAEVGVLAPGEGEAAEAIVPEPVVVT
jgi:radical SAM superfamily enzyme YgiQ (UPF0313 family)